MQRSRCMLKLGRLSKRNGWKAPLRATWPTTCVRQYAAPSRSLGNQIKRRARVTTIDLGKLPQGTLPSDPLPEQPLDSEGYPPVIEQARINMQYKFKHCVLLTRVGNFYELYFHQAEEWGPLLGIKVASKRTSMGPVPMAGFPFFQLDRFLKMLVQDYGKYVAISEEIAKDPSRLQKSGELRFDRQVRRVITPGTLIDEQFLNPYEHNYILAIHVGLPSAKTTESTSDDDISSANFEVPVGLSWLDLSSGDFFTQSIEMETLSSALSRICPREIVLHQQLEEVEDKSLSTILKEGGHIVTFHQPLDSEPAIKDWNSMLDNAVSSRLAETFTVEETASANLLLQYVQEQVPGLPLRLQAPIRRHADEYMNIDRNSLRGLEVLRTLRDGLYKGSLLQTVRRTSTESGARLLANRLTSPSMSPDVINGRLDLVESLLADEVLLEKIVGLLRRTFDSLRLVQKFSLGRGDADDLLELSKTVNVSRQVAEVLEAHSEDNQSLQSLLDRFHWSGPVQVADRISQAIDEKGLMERQRSQDSEAAEAAGVARDVLENHNAKKEDLESLEKRLKSKKYVQNSENGDEKSPQEDIWIMRRGASDALDKLHETLSDLLEQKLELAESLRQSLNASSLTLKFTPGLGHICHVRGKDTKIDLSTLTSARTVGSSKSTRSFYLPAWTELGNHIEQAKLRIRSEEQNIFVSLRDEVIQNLVLIRRNAAVLDDLDVGCSFARLAKEYDLKRPLLNYSRTHKIIGGRHMMVDAGLTESGRNFTPNDCMLGEAERIWLITGPNMAGKSTFLRQTALISILAQTGSFVPAEYAEIGLVDQIFSRVGSADNLSQDQSTFMVEMLETSHILRHATPRSFVIMDEVGRGTTPEDGIAVGYAVLCHLQQVNQCRALFATHFHALADMTSDFEGLAAYCTDVSEEPDGSFRYDHRLRKGVNRQSHALKVAMLAGMPRETVKLAGEALEKLKQPAREVA